MWRKAKRPGFAISLMCGVALTPGAWPACSVEGADPTFTIGGAVYTDLANPINSGLPGVTVKVECDGGFVGQALTGDPLGIWQLGSVPQTTCTIIPEMGCSAFEHVSDGVGDGRDQTTIVVNQARLAQNQSVQFLAGDESDACDDNDECTDDSCVSGVCVYVNNTAACDDEDPCTEDDTCLLGVCEGTAIVCPDGQRCDPADGVCRACLIDADCDDGNPCTDDSCHEGNCKHVDNTEPCDDGDSCTNNDQCAAGDCGGSAVDCSFLDGVCVFGACNPATGACETHYVADATPCDDGNNCTVNDVCLQGRCAGTADPSCIAVTPAAGADSDSDGVLDSLDECPGTALGLSVDDRGCACSQLDDDNDGVDNCDDECPLDPMKSAPGQCGCGEEDADADADGFADCVDDCPANPDKIEPGVCGCSRSDEDSDGDGVLDCEDGCPADETKTAPGSVAAARPMMTKTPMAYLIVLTSA